jgi:hypothetical protein
VRAFGRSARKVGETAAADPGSARAETISALKEKRRVSGARRYPAAARPVSWAAARASARRHRGWDAGPTAPRERLNRAWGIARGIDAEGQDASGSAHESPTRLARALVYGPRKCGNGCSCRLLHRPATQMLCCDELCSVCGHFCAFGLGVSILPPQPGSPALGESASDTRKPRQWRAFCQLATILGAPILGLRGAE